VIQYLNTTKRSGWHISSGYFCYEWINTIFHYVVQTSRKHRIYPQNQERIHTPCLSPSITVTSRSKHPITHSPPAYMKAAIVLPSVTKSCIIKANIMPFPKTASRICGTKLPQTSFLFSRSMVSPRKSIQPNAMKMTSSK